MRSLAALMIGTSLLAIGAPALGSRPGTEAPRPASASSADTADVEAELEEEQADLIDRIVDLQRQLDELESRLTPEARELLEARLVELEALPVEEAKAEALPVPASREPPDSPARMTRPTCNTLRPFDTSGDGALTGVDRYWRYLGLWIDGNGNGLLEDDEVVHPFDLGIVEISSQLKRFHSEPERGGTIRRGDRIYFEQLDNKGRTGVLVVDATRLRRGDGLDLRSASGEPLEGLREFVPGLTIVASDGQQTAINCP